MGGRARERQNRSFHRRLLIATEPLTVVSTACSNDKTASSRLEFGTSPLGVLGVTPPVAPLSPP